MKDYASKGWVKYGHAYDDGGTILGKRSQKIRRYGSE
jgi:hypothetical protein